MTPEIISKLEYAFLLGKNDLEACAEAKIGKSTLYDFQRKNPRFIDRKAWFQNNVKLRAKLLIVKAIENGCGKASRWWLTRYCKEEFSLRVAKPKNLGKITSSSGAQLPMQQSMQEVRKLLEGINL